MRGNQTRWRKRLTDAALGGLIVELVGHLGGAAEGLGLQRHRLLRLRVERRVLDQAVDEHPQVAAHLYKLIDSFRLIDRADSLGRV